MRSGLRQRTSAAFKGRVGRIGGTRELIPIGTPYIIGYRVTDRVEIVAIQHGAQEWPADLQA